MATTPKLTGRQLGLLMQFHRFKLSGVLVSNGMARDVGIAVKNLWAKAVIEELPLPADLAAIGVAVGTAATPDIRSALNCPNRPPVTGGFPDVTKMTSVELGYFNHGDQGLRLFRITKLGCEIVAKAALLGEQAS